MTNSTSEVLVLVANEKGATLCTNANGDTKVLRSIEPVMLRRPSHPDSAIGASARHLYACELMMALSRTASEHNYDGVVIFADARMMEELRGVQTSFISKKLIAEVIGMPSDPGMFPGRSAGMAKMAYRGAVQ